jgi:hypothetical protein
MDTKDKRRAHIFRIYKDDDQSSDTWVDIERIDAITFETGSGKDYRKWYYQYDWSKFDPKDHDTAEYKYITNAADSVDGTVSGISTSPPTDGRDFIKVPIRKALTVESGKGMDFQRTKHTHENGSNDKPDSTRKTHKRKVSHYDLGKDALDAVGQPPKSTQDYFNALDGSSMDDSNSIEVEVLDEIITTTGSGFTWRKWFWTLGSDADAMLADPLKKSGGSGGNTYFPLMKSE